MPTHPPHNVEPIDDLASQFKRLNQRAAALERASSTVSQATVDARIAAYGDTLFLTPAEGDAAYVNVGGDTMSGALVLSPGAEALRFNGANSYASFYNGTGTRQGYLQGVTGGVLLNSETGRLLLYGNDGITMTPFKINGYTASESTLANRIVLATAAGYIYSNYFNMTADVGAGYPAYIAGQNASDNFLRWYNKSGDFTSAAAVRGTQMIPSSGTNFYGTAGILVNPGAASAAIALHCGGVAPVHGSVFGNGNVVFFRDLNFTATTGIVQAATHAADSSKRWKKNITPWPMLAAGAAVERATDVVARLRPVTFEFTARDIEAPSPRRTKALLRVNRLRAAKNMPDYELPSHDCTIHECDGTADEPCIRVINWDKTRHGLIAEDVHEVLPSAVLLDTERLPSAIDLGQLLAVSLAAIQELTTRVAELEGAA